jgi:hypothetical protein
MMWVALACKAGFAYGLLPDAITAIAVDGYPGNDIEGDIVLRFRPVSARRSNAEAVVSQ